MLMRKLIRADGTSEELAETPSMWQIHRLIGAETLDVVKLRHLGEPLHVMLVDDNGYETETVQQGPGHFLLRPVRRRKPVNLEATKLYHANCYPGVEEQIVGDVVVVPDGDFESKPR
jgi:hypothetical protein